MKVEKHRPLPCTHAEGEHFASRVSTYLLLPQGETAQLVESARTSPYAPVLDEQEYGAATKFLPRAVYDQINYMIKAEHLHFKDVRAPPPPTRR